MRVRVCTHACACVRACRASRRACVHECVCVCAGLGLLGDLLGLDLSQLIWIKYATTGDANPSSRCFHGFVAAAGDKIYVHAGASAPPFSASDSLNRIFGNIARSN